jgi:predicted ester cyclase
MSIDKNEALAKQWFDGLWSRGNLDVADEIVSTEYAPDWIQIEATGPAQVKHEVRYFRSVFPDLEYEIVDMIATPDRVWVRYRANGTHRGSAWGFGPTGKQVAFEGATILYVNAQSEIVDRWGAFCMYDLLSELGLVPPFWELSTRRAETREQKGHP